MTTYKGDTVTDPTIGADELRALREAYRTTRSIMIAPSAIGSLVVPAGRTTDAARLPTLLAASDAPEVCAMFVMYARIIGLERLGTGWSLSCLPTWSDMGSRHIAGSLTIGTDRAFTITLDKSDGRIVEWALRVDGPASEQLGDRVEEQGQRHRYLVGGSFDEFAVALGDNLISAARDAVRETSSDGHRAERHNPAFAAFLGLEDERSGDGDDAHWEVEARYAWRETRTRLHQSEFRKRVFGGRAVVACEHCGITEQTVLEAAHVIPDADGGPSSSDNAAVLCCNHHRGFDAGLLVRDPDGRFVWAPGVTPF